MITISGDGRVWYGCSSEHVRAVILYINDQEPWARGVRTKGVIKIG